MRIFQINICGNLSTGKLAVEIAKNLKQNGDESLIAFARNEIADGVDYYRIGSRLNVLWHAAMSRLTDRAGFYSKRSTRKLIHEIEKYRPDIIQLHNLHGYYLNIEILFHFLREYGRPVVWTLHDCWAFTGHCCYFDYTQCNKWETGCSDCPAIDRYPKAFVDGSSRNYTQKEALFTSIENMTLVTPSHWLKGRVERSFLKKYPVEMIYNGIDLAYFRPGIDAELVRQEYHLEEKTIILGVASAWDARKGLLYFQALADRLPDKYQILMVGLKPKQIERLDRRILGLGLIRDVKTLARLYAAADIFLNASVEETFGLTTIEALACGTYTIVLRDTACAEIAKLSGGKVAERNLQAIEDAIYEYDPQKKVKPIDPKLFSGEIYAQNMIRLYKEKLKIQFTD
ncbi:MAG: glycosyltransferase [Acetatifactor sp.]|nr:glycosyltransferase [Acetatifactor sp.]